MGQVTVSDLLDQASLTFDSGGMKIVRKFLCEGLQETGSKKLYEAVTLPDIPLYGSFHPTVPGIVVSSLNVVPVSDSPSKAWVVVNYEPPSHSNSQPSESAPPTTEFGATSSNIETSQDANDNEMKLTHTWPQKIVALADGTNEAVPETTITQPTKVSVQEAHPYVSFQRMEPSPFNTEKVLLCVGRVNSVAWFTGAPRTWYCAAIRARLEGDVFQVSYEFQYREKTWDVVSIFNDPSTGLPVELDGNGNDIGTFQIYKEIDFNVLNLGV